MRVHTGENPNKRGNCQRVNKRTNTQWRKAQQMWQEVGEKQVLETEKSWQRKSQQVCGWAEGRREASAKDKKIKCVAGQEAGERQLPKNKFI